MRTDGQTDMSTLTVAFRNIATASDNNQFLLLVFPSETSQV